MEEPQDDELEAEESESTSPSPKRQLSPEELDEAERFGEIAGTLVLAGVRPSVAWTAANEWLAEHPGEGLPEWVSKAPTSAVPGAPRIAMPAPRFLGLLATPEDRRRPELADVEHLEPREVAVDLDDEIPLESPAAPAPSEAARERETPAAPPAGPRSRAASGRRRPNDARGGDGALTVASASTAKGSASADAGPIGSPETAARLLPRAASAPPAVPPARAVVGTPSRPAEAPREPGTHRPKEEPMSDERTVRDRIVEQLSKGPRTSGELVEALGLATGSVTGVLSAMRKSGDAVKEEGYGAPWSLANGAAKASRAPRAERPAQSAPRRKKEAAPEVAASAAPARGVQGALQALQAALIADHEEKMRAIGVLLGK